MRLMSGDVERGTGRDGEIAAINLRSNYLASWGNPEAEYLELEAALEVALKLARELFDESGNNEIFFAIHFDDNTVGSEVG